MISTIGCCDSGLGGMLVVDALHQSIPNLNIVYIADQSHVPYGDKTVDQLFKYTRAILDQFKLMGISNIVIACNTLCANVLDDIRNEYPELNLYGIIEPTCLQLKDKGYKKIGVLATNKTIEKHAYLNEIKKVSPESEVLEVKAPKFVPIIENGFDTNLLQQAIAEYCQESVDAWILGCTHYPLIRPYLKDKGDLYDSNQAVISLFKNEEVCGEGKVFVYTSGDPQKMKANIKYLLNTEYDVQSIELKQSK